MLLWGWPARDAVEKIPGKFYELIDSLLERDEIKLSELATVLGSDLGNISRAISKRTLSDDRRQRLIVYLYDEVRAISGILRRRSEFIPDALYFALLNFYGIKETSQDNARALALGTYELWRRSVEHKEEYVHGRVDFFADKESPAVKVKMVQKRKSRPGIRQSIERYEGFLVRIADMYVMLLRDVANNDLRVTVFNRFRIEYIGENIDETSVYPPATKHLVHLDGFGLGIDGNKVFFAPVYMALIDDRKRLESFDDELDVKPESEVPSRILRRLDEAAFLTR